MNTFINEQIDIKDLPAVEALVFQPLERRYLNVLIISRVILILLLIGVFVAGIISLGSFVPNFVLYVGGILFFLLMILSLVSAFKGYYNKSYALRQRDIVYKTGWLWKDLTTVPFNRVQHVSIDQGPVERNFTLAKLKIYTAGGSSSDLTIPGLHPETAETLKEFITKKTPSYEEE